MKSATHLTNLSFIKNVNKSIPDMAEIFISSIYLVMVTDPEDRQMFPAPS